MVTISETRDGLGIISAFNRIEGTVKRLISFHVKLDIIGVVIKDSVGLSSAKGYFVLKEIFRLTQLFTLQRRIASIVDGLVR